MPFTPNTRKTLARLLLRALVDRRLPPREAGHPLHIVVPRWDAKLGDAIVSSFFFREARKLGAQVTVLTVAGLAELHRVDFAVERVIEVSANPSLGQLLRLARELGQVDALVHLVGRIQPAEMLFIRWLQPRLVYSLDDPLRCVNRKLGAATAHLPVAERFARVLADLGAQRIDQGFIVPLPDPLPDIGRTRILVNPHASRTDKSLGFTKAVTLCRVLADAWPQHAIGILCSPATRAEALQLQTAIAREQVRAMVELDTPRRVAGAMHQALAVISVDTAIVHMAVGLQVPLVAIYPASGAAGNPWLPPASPLAHVVFSQQDAGHYQRTGEKNMDAFSEHEVLAKLSILLGNSSAAALDQCLALPQPIATVRFDMQEQPGQQGTAGEKLRQ